MQHLKAILAAICLFTSLFLTSSFAQAEDQVVTEVMTKSEVVEEMNKESRSLSSWKKQDRACYHAIASARRKAENDCKHKKKGEIIPIKEAVFNELSNESKPIKYISECNPSDCTQNKYSKQWTCTGKVTMKCVYTIEKQEEDNIIKIGKGAIRKHIKPNNPCIEDTSTVACIDYRKSINATQGVRD